MGFYPADYSCGSGFYPEIRCRMQLLDSYGRKHDYLRISLTDNCNLRCFYCMPEEEISCTSRANLMNPDEIFHIASVFVKLGVRKIRLTGGEPLVRKEAAGIIEKLSALPVELTLTTNGTQLHLFKDIFQQHGIRSLNISLDTLDADKFYLLTRRNVFRQVMDNIQMLVENGFHVKINMVVMRGINDSEINTFARWSYEAPVHVRFIEFMPFTGNSWHGDKVFPRDEMLQSIAKEFAFIPLIRENHATADKYFIEEAKGSFAIISSMSKPFCGDCNRLRLTADGKMKNCLFSATETDILQALRRGEEIEPFIIDNILQKKEKLGGQFDANYMELNAEKLQNRSMISIGG